MGVTYQKLAIARVQNQVSGPYIHIHWFSCSGRQATKAWSNTRCIKGHSRQPVQLHAANERSRVLLTCLPSVAGRCTHSRLGIVSL